MTLFLKKPPKMESEVEVVSRMRPGLGTFVEIRIEGLGAREAIEWAYIEVERLETVLSRFRKGSEIGHFVRGEVARKNCSVDLRNVLDFADQMEKTTGKIFCARSPYSKNENDYILDGVAKGYVVDRVFEGLKARGEFQRISINAGGDLRIEAQNPEPVLVGWGLHRVELGTLSTGSVATSTDEFRDEPGVWNQAEGAHLGESVEEFGAVAIAPTCMIADAWTKVIRCWPFIERERPSGSDLAASKKELLSLASEMGVIGYLLNKKGENFCQNILPE